LLKAKGDYDGAEPLFREALAIDKKVYGEDHPEVATDLNNLAQLLKKKGDEKTASSMGKEALRIRLKVLGPDHPHTKSAQRKWG